MVGRNDQRNASRVGRELEKAPITRPEETGTGSLFRSLPMGCRLVIREHATSVVTMAPHPTSQKIHDRIEKSQEAIQRFARINEEYRTLQKEVSPGPARARIDELIRLNNATAAVVKRGLILSEADLGRAQKLDDE
jgi:hypothetical protein